MSSVEVDPGARLHDGPAGALLVGGQPLRVLKLNPAAARVVAGWQAGGGSPAGAAETALATRLHRTGLAVLRADTSPWTAADVTVVVPARDRAGALDRCLASVGDGPRVLVVDDASRDAAAVARVAGKHGAELVVRAVNGGPGAARNTGLAAVGTPLVGFVDSDCVLPPGWLVGLLPVLADGTAVAAPRVVGRGGDGPLARYETTAGPLDLGAAAGPVGAGTRVGYLPAAVLLCRRDALGAGFDETMRVGEDVDLVWRVAGAGHPVRYEPRVVVEHETRTGFGSWFGQRQGYGRGGAALAARHPDRLAPVVISRWSLPALACLAARKPGWALGCTALTAVGLWTRLPAGPGRAGESARLTAQGLGWTLLGLAEAAARPWLPALLAASVVSRRARRATALALAVRLVRTRGGRSPDLAPATWAALRVADDLAYGTGIWQGVLRDREPGPVLPRIV
ncbi:MAG TPA: mycofactocin biosynthesis glycosyltransferase MftF [Mycobacteriales bacterium]|nr:mycofactocin biosynthesis glycosyltransferase MftF [Mycobacteriales bacterium]